MRKKPEYTRNIWSQRTREFEKMERQWKKLIEEAEDCRTGAGIALGVEEIGFVQVFTTYFLRRATGSAINDDPDSKPSRIRGYSASDGVNSSGQPPTTQRADRGAECKYPVGEKNPGASRPPR